MQYDIWTWNLWAIPWALRHLVDLLVTSFKKDQVLEKMFLCLGCDNLEVKENSVWSFFSRKRWLNVVRPEGQSVVALSWLMLQVGCLYWCRDYQVLPAGGALCGCWKKGNNVYILYDATVTGTYMCRSWLKVTVFDLLTTILPM